MNIGVRAWQEKITIPTYQVGTPEKNPMFFKKRVYLGSSGVVYPHTIIEKIADHKIDEVYDAVLLENKHLKCCHLELMKIAIPKRRFTDDMQLLNALEQYTVNLGEEIPTAYLKMVLIIGKEWCTNG